MLRACFENDNLVYLESILLKYFSKNRLTLAEGLNYLVPQHHNSDETILNLTPQYKIKWLKLYFDISEKCV